MTPTRPLLFCWRVSIAPPVPAPHRAWPQFPTKGKAWLTYEPVQRCRGHWKRGQPGIRIAQRRDYEDGALHQRIPSAGRRRDLTRRTPRPMTPRATSENRRSALPSHKRAFVVGGVAGRKAGRSCSRPERSFWLLPGPFRLLGTIQRAATRSDTAPCLASSLHTKDKLGTTVIQSNGAAVTGSVNNQVSAYHRADVTKTEFDINGLLVSGLNSGSPLHRSNAIGRKTR